MAPKFSEMTALRVDLARNLEAGFDNYKEEIAAGYDRFVTPLLAEGDEPPDVRFQMELMKRGLRHCSMKGVRALDAACGERLVGAAYTLRFVPFR